MRGHVPGHLRVEFEEYLDYWYCKCEEPDLGDMSINHLLGKLWNCTDTLPSRYCGALDIPQGSSYAKAVRKFKEQLEAAE